MEDKLNGCDLMGPVGFTVQILLGVVSFLVLIYKRIREKPKRQWKVWGLDTSKQGCSQLIGHAFNVLLAIHMSGDDSDECVKYLSVLVLDTTMGVLICYVVLKLSEMVLESLNLTNYCSGNYFLIIMPEDQVQKNEMNNQKVPTNTHLLKPIIKIDLKSWLYQLLIWVSIVCASKSFLYLIQLGMSSGLETTSGYILSPFENLPTLKLIIVMMCIPVIMNGFQFWIQDNFLKKTQFTTQEKRYVMSEMYVDERQASFAQLENYVNNPQDPKGSTHNLNLPLEMEVMQKKHNGYQKAELGDNE